MKQKAFVSVYLVLFKNDKILLSKRHNTGYEDGKWGLVAGHVETGESATIALAREVFEEIGINIDHNHLVVSHVMHRKSDRENIDIFITCNKWEKDIFNKEPEKCAALEFFSISKLPENTIEYIKQALFHIRNSLFYNESGWLDADLK